VRPIQKIKTFFMQEEVIKYFKRNANATICHLVLGETFGEGEREAAGKYAKSKNGVVTTATREEYDAWVSKNVKSETEKVSETKEKVKSKTKTEETTTE
jgi:CO dehydrogenase/acetyl-CoA synthase epsilon subunit